MTFNEKSQWVSAIAAFTMTTVYFAWIAVQAMDQPITSVDYHAALPWLVGVLAAIQIIGMKIARRDVPHGADKPDARDREINLRGDAIGYRVLMWLVAVPLLLGFFDFHMFWVIHTLFAALALSGLVGVVARSVLYRRGVSDA